MRLRAGRVRWDHPRACGEQQGVCPDGLIDLGSSPRVRGAGVDSSYNVATSGIIPARAGSSQTSTTRFCRNGDHPRACGEQVLEPALGHRFEGSSPRVRGAGCSVLCVRVYLGIIPARAGSSMLSFGDANET